MSSFKHHRNNNDRYNIYENYIEVVEVKSFYETLRNTLFFIALTSSLFVTSLIFFDTYKNKKDKNLQLLAVSNTIMQTIEGDDTLKNINPHQLQHIIKHVMEKIENSPNQIIYTKK